MVRRYLAAGLWVVLTVTATVIVWAAVSVVAADVTDRPAPVVAHRDVVVALQAASTTTTTTSAVAAPPRTAAPVTSSTVASRPTTTIPGGPTPTVPPPVFAPTTTTAPAAHGTPTTKATTKPSTPTTAPAVGGTATYSNSGGTVAVACTSFSSIRLVAALPNDGFQAVVTTPGPLFVQVNFVGPGQNLAISAICFFGQPFQGNKAPPGG